MNGQILPKIVEQYKLIRNSRDNFYGYDSTKYFMKKAICKDKIK